MDEQSPPSEPVEPDKPPPMPVIPLGYQAKSDRWRRATDEGIGLAIFRRSVFAVGMALLMTGLAGAISPRFDRDSRQYVGWGTLLVVLVVPLGPSWRRWQADDPPRKGPGIG